MTAACPAGQTLPFSVTVPSTVHGGGVYYGATASEACGAAVAAKLPGADWSISGTRCVADDGDLAFSAVFVQCDVAAPSDDGDGGSSMSVTCSGSCTVTHVIQVDVPILNLSPAEGAEIAGAVLAVWAVAWVFRVLIRGLREIDGNSSTSESE